MIGHLLAVGVILGCSTFALTFRNPNARWPRKDNRA